VSEKYKIIEINLGRNLNSEELAIIKELEEKFSRRDFFFHTENFGVLFYLNSIDLNAFKNSVYELMERHKYAPEDKNLFLEIIAKIENIRSYGIKGGKRIYVDYYKERKVKNRLQKVLQRGMYFYALNNNFTPKPKPKPKPFECLTLRF
jgi:hypothetical protein